MDYLLLDSSGLFWSDDHWVVLVEEAQLLTKEEISGAYNKAVSQFDTSTRVERCKAAFAGAMIQAIPVETYRLETKFNTLRAEADSLIVRRPNTSTEYKRLAELASALAETLGQLEEQTKKDPILYPGKPLKA